MAIFWHLGSLARGAFTLALLRLLRWALWLLHVALGQATRSSHEAEATA